MTSIKRIENSEISRFVMLSHLTWALTFLFLSTTFSMTAAGQSSDGSSSTPRERTVQLKPETSPLPPPHVPRPELCKRSADCRGGHKDNFMAPGEQASPSSWLINKLANCAGVHTEFDTKPKEGHCFGHTFTKCLNTKCKVIGARLKIRMQAFRSLSNNDDITIFSGGLLLWAKPIITLLEANGTWKANQTATFIIDLGALPGGGNVLNQLTGSLDVTVQDDTRIDYMQLTVRTDCCGHACGTKYEDKNGNGTRDPGEPRLSGWTMVLDGGQGNTHTTTTNSDGAYCFDQIQPGAYTLGELAQTGWAQTSPAFPGQHILKIATGQTVDGLDFGNQLCKPREPAGACCTPKGCKQTTRGECREHGGLWHGTESQCPVDSHK